MTTLRAIADAVASRPGKTAVAVALVLQASAALAQGDVDAARTAATASLRSADSISADDIIEGDLRAQLRVAVRSVDTTIDESTKASLAKLRNEERSTKADPQRRNRLRIAIDELTRDQRIAAAARDLAAAAGMASRGNADYANVVRASLASLDDTLDEDRRWKIMSKEIGLPIRIEDPTYRMRYEAL